MLFAKQCAHLQNVQTAFHRDCYHQHLYSHIHLKSQVRLFAKSQTAGHQNQQTEDSLFSQTHASPLTEWPSFFATAGMVPCKIY